MNPKMTLLCGALAVLPITLGCDLEGALDVDLTLGKAEAATAVDDSASLSLPKLDDLRLLGYRVSDNFTSDGGITVSLLPFGPDGEAILDGGVYIEMVATSNVPFPMSGEISIGTLVQPAAQKPFRFGITLDGSGSMESSDENRLRIGAAGQFVDVITEAFPGSQFAAMEFESEITLLTDFTDDPAAFKTAIADVGAEGGTELHKSSNQMLDLLIENASADYQPAMLVLSDGLDTGDEVSSDDVVTKANAHDIPIHALGLGGALDIPGLDFVGDLQEYASKTGGVFTYIDGATNLNRSFENMALGTSKGQLLAEVKITGGLFVPFSTITIVLKVHAGGAVKEATFDFIVPLS